MTVPQAVNRLLQTLIAAERAKQGGGGTLVPGHRKCVVLGYQIITNIYKEATNVRHEVYHAFFFGNMFGNRIGLKISSSILDLLKE